MSEKTEKIKKFLELIIEKTKSRSIIWINNAVDEINDNFYIIEDSDFIDDHFVLGGFFDANDKYQLHIECDSVISDYCDEDDSEDMVFDFNYDHNKDEDNLSAAKSVWILLQELEDVVKDNALQTKDDKENSLMDFLINAEWTKNSTICNKEE